MWEGVKQIFSGAIDLIMGIMSLTFVGGIRTAIANLAKTVINAIKNKWSSVVELFRGGGTNALNAVKNMATNVWNGVKNLATNFVNTIVTMKNNVVAKFNEIKTSVINKVKEIDLLQIGKDIVKGLISGIGNMFGNVKDKVAELANLVPDWAKKVLGIKSPARKMIPIGRDIILGWVKGMDDNSNKIEKSIEDISEKLLDVSSEYATKEQELRDKHNEDMQKANDETWQNVFNIQQKALKEKRDLTYDEEQKIMKIEKDFHSKKKTAEKKFEKDLLKMQEDGLKARLSAIESYVSDKKSLDQLTSKQEAEIWKESIAQFEVGSNQRIKAQQNYQKAIEAARKEDYDNLKKSVDKHKELGLLPLKAEAQVWKASLSQFEVGSKEYEDASKNHQDVLKSINEKTIKINEDFSDQIKKIDDDAIKKIEEANKKYTDAYNNRYKQLLNAKDIFDKSDALKETDADLTGNLKSQVDALKVYASEMERLRSRNLNADLFSEISNKGVDALPEILKLNRMSNDQIAEYNNLFEERARLARKQTDKEMAGMKADTEKAVAGLKQSASREIESLQSEWLSQIQALTSGTEKEFMTLESIGKNAIRGLKKGIDSVSGELHKTVSELATSVRTALGEAFDVPRYASLTNAVASAQSSLNSSYNKAQTNAAAKDSITNNTNINMAGLVEAIVDLANRPQQLNLDGKAIATTVSERQYGASNLHAIMKGVIFGK